MKYLVVYPAAGGGNQSKDLLATEAEAKEFIENLLVKENVSESQVELYEVRPVHYQVERVPVVNISGGGSLPEMDKADIPEIITTEEEVEAETAPTAVTQEETATAQNREEEKEEENLEVFTFES